MKEILETVIINLVESPNDVSINKIEKKDLIVFEVKVAGADMGRVIGKQGRMAKAIRTLMKAIGVKENKKISIEFID